MTHTAEAVDIQALRARLEEMQVSLLDRRRRLKAHISNRDEPLPADFAEQAVELENDEAMVAIDGELATELRNVESALARFEDGTYGFCSRCGEAILPERLSALPETILCIHCAGVGE